MTSLTLSDGRRLDVMVSGEAHHLPLLFHHGTPGSRHQFELVRREAHEHDLRLVTWSRPGYGASERSPGRSVADAAADAEAVLDLIGADSCLTAGWSGGGGGPHALACGALLPERVRAVLCIAGVAPYDADGLEWLAGMGEDNLEEFGAALEGEAALRPWLGAARSELAQINGDQISASMSSLLPPVDVAALTGDFAADLATSIREAVSAGVDGWLDDDLAFTRSWGFDLDDLVVPTSIWQGSEDLMVPFAHGAWLAARLPHATRHLEQGEGHVSITAGAFGRMLDELVDLA
ncbi:Alpha/beta hydrolase fold protein [metagenome]|uniref:Alpha/beta hydrolase fold protein n=1 Tax=metagenome TaxID=256318 RepID=A0A2P2BZ35_9ZZZZ